MKFNWWIITNHLAAYQESITFSQPGQIFHESQWLHWYQKYCAYKAVVSNFIYHDIFVQDIISLPTYLGFSHLKGSSGQRDHICNLITFGCIDNRSCFISRQSPAICDEPPISPLLMMQCITRLGINNFFVNSENLWIRIWRKNLRQNWNRARLH